MARQTCGVDTAYKQIAPFAIAITHVFGRIVTQTKSREGAFLADARRTKHGILVNLHHRLNQRRRTAGITKAESRHRKSLRKTVEQDRALPHPWQARDARMHAFEY